MNGLTTMYSVLTVREDPLTLALSPIPWGRGIFKMSSLKVTTQVFRLKAEGKRLKAITHHA